MKVLVTGGGGFIGIHVVNELVSKGHSVTVFSRGADVADRLPSSVRCVTEDLNNRGALQEALRDVEVVYHLAWSGVHQSSNQDLRAHVEMNLLPTLNLLELCRDAGVRRIVFTSSGGAVYGSVLDFPITEQHATHPISAYGATKLSAESFIELYGHLHDLDYVILRPSVPYGEYQSPRGRQGAVAVFLGKLQRGEPIVIWGDGTAIRDFFYVGDLARACVLASDRMVERGIYNIGGGEPVILNNLISLMLEVTGARVPVIYEPPRIFDPPAIVLDINKARRVLDWQPTINLHDGIAKTWKWIQSHG